MKEPLTLKVIKDTTALLTRSAFIRIIRIPATIVTANILGPAGFGLLKIIDFIPSLSKYGSLGFDSVAFREITHLRGSGKSQKEHLIRNVAFSSQMLWSLFLAFLVFCASFFYKQIEVRWGLRIASFSLFAYQINRLYTVNCKIEKNFVLLAKVGALSSVVTSIIIISTVYWGRIYSVLLGGLIGILVAIVIYQLKIGLNFRPYLRWGELRRQVRIGIPLALGTFVYGGFGWTERLVVGKLWGLEILGIYMLLFMIGKGILQIVSTLLQASSVHLYERLGSQTHIEKIQMGKMIFSPTLTFATLFPLIGAAIIFLGPAIIQLIMPKYDRLIPLLPWLAIFIWVRSVPSMYLTSMNSARINQQIRFVIFWIVTIILFALFTFIFYSFGLGIFSPFLAKILSFNTLAVLAFLSTWRYLTPTKQTFCRELFDYFLPLIWGIIGMGVVYQLSGSYSYLNFLRFFIFLVLYLPILFRWESKVGFFKLLKVHLRKHVTT